MATRAVEIQAKIREQVLNGELPGGMRMNEADLAAALGVSRTPVRNALSTLGAEGLLKYTPNSGYVVRSYTEKDLQDIFEVRALLHGAAARIAAERGLSQRHYEDLREAIDEGDRLVAQGIWSDAILARWRDVNESFHDTLFAAADNAHLNATYLRAQHFPFARELAWRRFDAGDMGRSQSDHAGIFEAVLSRQGSRADALAREHNYRFGRRMVEQWRLCEAERKLRRAPA